MIGRGGLTSEVTCENDFLDLHRLRILCIVFDLRLSSVYLLSSAECFFFRKRKLKWLIFSTCIHSSRQMLYDFAGEFQHERWIPKSPWLAWWIDIPLLSPSYPHITTPLNLAKLIKLSLFHKDSGTSIEFRTCYMKDLGFTFYWLICFSMFRFLSKKSHTHTVHTPFSSKPLSSEVAQQPLLFDTSIRNNLTYGCRRSENAVVKDIVT